MLRKGEASVGNATLRTRAWTAAFAAAATMAFVSVSGAAEMTVGDQLLRPATSGTVFVSGSINNEPTFGWSVLIDLVPRDGARGSLTFTPVLESEPAPRPTITIRQRAGTPAILSLRQRHPASLDIRQVKDVWPGLGTFTPFDTAQSGSPARNGAVDDNGSFVQAPATFSGVLASFPIQASADAEGVWDVVLHTNVGASGFEGVATDLIHGSITVTPDACASSVDCDDQDSCTRDTCRRGACTHAYSERDCGRGQATKQRSGSRRK